MILSVRITEKSLGLKELFRDFVLHIQEGEKVAIIGRNGVGKTTLFRVLSGEDEDRNGVNIELKKGASLVVTKQEHDLDDEITPLQYILEAVPDYLRLKKIIDDYGNHTGEDMDRLQEFSDTLHAFGERDFYSLEDIILSDLESYGLSAEQANAPMARLSGGEKRFVELVKVSHAEADLALIDEPTNHMDYIGKDRFISWLRGTKLAVCVISHDRDVLAEVDRIIEVKDKKAHSFKGNYASYLKHNSVATLNQVGRYEDGIRRLATLDKLIDAARAKKARDSRAKAQEVKFMREREELAADLEKPSFWIDQETLAQTNDKLLAGYNTYKDKNIRIQTGAMTASGHELLTVDALSIGYESPLFQPISFRLSHGDRVRLHGRNGAGKSSLLRDIQATVANQPLPVFPFAGSISMHSTVRVGVYEQEVDRRFLGLTLGQAIDASYAEHKINLSEQALYALLSSYLFQPTIDKGLLVEQLSGGQKARFQMIRLLCHNPNLLILDEPTNHLDLPSIEELERALLKFHGAILYVSHDSCFYRALGGQIISLTSPL